MADQRVPAVFDQLKEQHGDEKGRKMFKMYLDVFADYSENERLKELIDKYDDEEKGKERYIEYLELFSNYDEDCTKTAVVEGATYAEIMNERKRLLNIRRPDGKRYMFPNIFFDDPFYDDFYIHMMQILEKDPGKFARITAKID